MIIQILNMVEHSLSIAQAGLKKNGISKNNILQKLIQLVLIYYLPLELHKISILSILSKDLFNSSIFERLDIFKIKIKKKIKIKQEIK